MERESSRSKAFRSCLKATKIHNIDGKILGKDGKPMQPIRKVQNPGTNAMKSPDTVVNTSSIPQPKSFVSTLNAEKKTSKINFGVLFNEDHVDNANFVLLVENVEIAHNRFANSLVVLFVGKSVAFPLVQNYVINTWSKFGFQKVMLDHDGVFYFKFTFTTGLEQVLEQGPWMIRNQPLILNKWAPNLVLSKDEVSKVPVWVKIHKVPVVAYSEDGLSLIASQIRKPIMLDAFTSAMHNKLWERIGFACAVFEVSADKDLKKEVTMVVLILNGEGHTMERMVVEYEWTPLCCSDCHVFRHNIHECPKQVVEPVNEMIEA
ncbi:hypothetical protein Tco_0753098 [Tanacetum coccineum]